jgi:hypothetical protein
LKVRMRELRADAAASVQDVGKPLSVAATVDVPLAVDHLRYFAGYAPPPVLEHACCMTTAVQDKAARALPLHTMECAKRRSAPGPPQDGCIFGGHHRPTIHPTADCLGSHVCTSCWMNRLGVACSASRFVCRAGQRLTSDVRQARLSPGASVSCMTTLQTQQRQCIKTASCFTSWQVCAGLGGHWRPHFRWGRH